LGGIRTRQGAAFFFTIPLVQTIAEAPPANFRLKETPNIRDSGWQTGQNQTRCRNYEGSKAVEILLIEDNPGDARLALEAIREAKVHNNLSWVADGVEALAYLRREGKHTNALRPDLILLDLNLPKKDGGSAGRNQSRREAETHPGGCAHHLSGRRRHSQSL